MLVLPYIFLDNFFPDRLSVLTAYLFSPRKSPPTPIGHLGEGAHKVPTYDFTLLPIVLHHHIREFHWPKGGGTCYKD
jgi:hypothetical protein